jgi:hypothetical protein
VPISRAEGNPPTRRRANPLLRRGHRPSGAPALHTELTDRRDFRDFRDFLDSFHPRFSPSAISGDALRIYHERREPETWLWSAMMKNLKVYLPTPRFAIAVLITLAATVLILRQFSTNPTVAKVKSYLGLVA